MKNPLGKLSFIFALFPLLLSLFIILLPPTYYRPLSAIILPMFFIIMMSPPVAIVLAILGYKKEGRSYLILISAILAIISIAYFVWILSQPFNLFKS